MLKKLLKAAMLTVCAAAMLGTLSADVEAKPKHLSKKAKVGDMVYFGKYEQDGKKSNGKEKLTWRVLDKKGNKVLIVTEKLIDMRPYHDHFDPITWEKSDIRKWLNKDFTNAAFSSAEKQKIQSTKVVNKDGKYGADGGNDTTDKVFLLSAEEAEKYFKSDDDRKAKVTEYFKQELRKFMIFYCSREEVGDDSIRQIEEEQDNCYNYWLRSPGYGLYIADSVGYDGAIYVSYLSGDKVEELGDGAYNCVRPALWVNL